MLRLPLLFLTILLTLSACTPTAQKAPLRPNIIYIMTDDHTRQALSLYGSKLINTPNMDRIGREGIRFDRAFVTNSICAPSRAVLLTGKYSHLNGLRDNHDTFDGAQMTFPKLLQAGGYQTFLVGKWHLKTPPTGFDYWNVLPGQGDYYNPRMIEMGDTSSHTGYTTDIITDFAIQAIDSMDQSKPFCLLYHHKAPHRNWMPNLKHLSLFNDGDLPMPETFFDDYSTRSDAARKQDMKVADMYLSLDMKLHPEYFGAETGTGGFVHPNFDPTQNWQHLYNNLTPEQKAAWDEHYQPINEEFNNAGLSGEDLAKWKYQRYIKDYLRCVVSVDENIGRLMDHLESIGQLDNTLIIYTSDQGFYLGEHGWYDKRFMYEESFSTPLLMRYPASIKAGQTSEDLVMNLDFAPTILDYAGVEIPAEMQGKSLRQLAEGNTPDDWRNSMYYHYYQSTGWHHVPKHYGIRNHRHKLIHYYEEGAWELYDLQQDPSELNNLYGTKGTESLTEELKAELQRLQAEYLDPVTE